VIWLHEMYAQATEAFRSFRDREEGQGLVEYALILVLVSIAAITVLGLLGTDIAGVFQDVRDAL
jgi:pilus assembly protein Flp/PilA